MENFINQFFIFGAEYLYIVIIVIALVYFLKQPKATKIQIIIFGITTLPLIYIVAKIISLFYYDPRPFVEGNFMPLISHVPDNGFPSDHTLLSAAIASVFYPFNKKVAVALWAFVLIIGFSRVYTGIHHPIDVLGSMAIASVVASLVYFFIKNSKILSVDDLLKK